MAKKKILQIQAESDDLTVPQDRIEGFLAKAAGLVGTMPEGQFSRLERYLAIIAAGGGGGGAPIDSPTFTGVPKAPTAAKGTDTTQIATTQFVQTAIGDKQDALTFDTAPTFSSPNVVTSGAIAKWTCPPLYLYNGEDLTVKFQNEIAQYSDFGAWLNARLDAKDVSGIFVKDYFRFTTSNNVTLTARIGDINHDLGYGDTEIAKWHIDFICDELWPDNHVWNKVNYNNGLAAEPSPWLCSDLYHFLNSLSGNVPNDTGADPATVAVDYTSTGVLDKFPAWLRDAIVERRSLEPTRYTAGALLTDDNSWAWKNIGKLWVPSEIEYYGFVAWGTRNGYSIGEGHMYPLLRDSKMRIKRKPDGSRYYLWLRRAYSGSSTGATTCYYCGHANRDGCTTAWVAPPVCFRIMAN